MMQEIVSSKRKWRSEEDNPTRPPIDHDEEEAKEYRNENIDDFNMNSAARPSVEIVERPKRIKKPSSIVLSPYIVYKKKLQKTNAHFDVKKAREFYASLQASLEREFRMSMTIKAPLRWEFWRNLLALDGSNEWFETDVSTI
ncbi:hypothetical protein L1987_87635 [Smallanthus sonchifolius]|nr:hypothetical protein L1987_87635 [Smallanthus sonchifolius]